MPVSQLGCVSGLHYIDGMAHLIEGMTMEQGFSFYVLPPLSRAKKHPELFGLWARLVEKQLPTCQHLLAFRITRKHWNPMTKELRRLNK